MTDTTWLNDLMGWYERDGETWQPKSWEMSEDLNVTNVKTAILTHVQELIAAAEREASINELYELAKTFEISKTYRGYMVKQVISARAKWVSDDGKIHIGITDIDDVVKLQQEGQK